MQINRAWMPCLIALLFVGSLSAQSQFSIHAASDQPVQGWQRMQVEHSNRFVWVAPIAAIVATDVERAEPQVRADGDTVVAVTFTDSGAQKARDLSVAQRKKLVALIVDGKVLWAPIVQSEISKESVLTGNGPHGLTQDEVERIMSIFR